MDWEEAAESVGREPCRKSIRNDGWLLFDEVRREMSKDGDLIGVTRAYRILKNLIASGRVEVQHFYAETSVGGKFKKPFYKLVTTDTPPEGSQSE